MTKPRAKHDVLASLLDAVSSSLNEEAARKLVGLRVDGATQARIDRLARRCNEGKLTPAERGEYETYVDAIDFVAILQAKARARLAVIVGDVAQVCE